MGDAMGFLATIFGGPLLGILGSLASGWFKMKEKEAEALERQYDRGHELALLELQGEQRSQDREGELAIAQADAASRQVTASMRHDIELTKRESQWVTNIKALFRPGITLILVLLDAAMFFKGVEVADLTPIREMIVTGIVFLTEVAVTWWFGDRAREALRR